MIKLTHERDRSIDMFKVLLVIGMIICHCIMLLKIYGIRSFIVSEYFNVITFSGFLFCFGYAVSIAYLPKIKKEISKKLIKNCLRMLSAFYISGIGYELLVNKGLSVSKLANILILNHMPGYSEFLAGFFVLNLLTLAFFNQFKRLLSSNIAVFITIVLSLLATHIPYHKVPSIQLGLILGSTKFSSFPIVQYFGYYLIGAYFQQNKLKLNVKFLIISVLCSLVFLQYAIAHHMPPLRFPPSLRWTIGGSGVLYGYYGLSMWLSDRIKKTNPIYFIGENTLQFLVVSNLLIFFLKGLLNVHANSIACLLIIVTIISISYGLILLFKWCSKHNLLKITPLYKLFL